ncbi:MAG: cysteine-rich CWC family protein [Gemmatimonadota bacterium]
MRCPLCGGPNHCALATGGTDVGSCWCASMHIPQEVLARLKPEQRGVSCVCRQCARADDDWPTLAGILAERLKRARRDH